MAINQEPDQEMEDITRQYAGMRRGLRAQQGATSRQAKRSRSRFLARTGGAGAAGEKMAQKSEAEIGRGFGADIASVSGQEAGARQQLLGQRAERTFTAEEAEKQRGFAAQEAALQRTFTAEEAAKQREEQIRQFDLMYSFQQMEFTENQKTNIINASVAAKKAGLKKPEDWERVSSGLRNIYGEDRVPIYRTNYWEGRARDEELQRNMDFWGRSGG